MRVSRAAVGSVSLLFGVAYARLTQVELEGGLVRGAQCNDSDSTQFLALPYALPPVGDLRWESPIRWNGTFEGGSFNATRPPPFCTQFSGPGSLIEDPGQEDCLYLNVYVPDSVGSNDDDDDDDNRLRPVKVFVHGGGGAVGGISESLYDGCAVSDEDDTIIVTVSYRLGPFGWLPLASAGIHGNFGIEDVILGLQWVQENIEKFGGNKDQVLLFGQSAGAWMSWVISTNPDAPKWMAATAPMSGGGNSIQNNATAQEGGRRWVAQTNCSATDAACLRRLPAEAFANININPQNPGIGGFSPINPAINIFVDGKIVPEQPSVAGIQVPTIFGSTADEGQFFSLFFSLDPSRITEELWTATMAYEFGPLADEVIAQYPIADYEYHPFPEFMRASQVITDYTWKCPTWRAALKAQEKGIPAWIYFFARQPTCPLYDSLPQEAWDLLGALHGADVPYAFDHTENLPSPSGNCSFTPEERRVSEILIESFTSLAARGNASTDDHYWSDFNNETYIGLLIGQNSTDFTSLADIMSICPFWDQIDALLLEAASNNAPNATDEINPSPTISTGTLPTETGDEPSAGVRQYTMTTSLVLLLSVVVSALML